jgi:hypothetical protein
LTTEQGLGHGTARKLLADQPVVREISSADGTLRLSVEQGEQALPSLLRVLDRAGITLESINLSRPTLDDVFLTLTGRSLRGRFPGARSGARGPRRSTRRGGPEVTVMGFIHDTLLIFRRQERLALRQPAWVIIGLTQLILYLVLFGPLLKGCRRPRWARAATPTGSSCPACSSSSGCSARRSWASRSSLTGGPG